MNAWVTHHVRMEMMCFDVVLETNLCQRAGVIDCSTAVLDAVKTAMERYYTC